MNDTEWESRLADRIHELADQVDPPGVPVEADLARGRRRVRNGRVAMLGAALAVGVVVSGTNYLVHTTRSNATVAGPAASGSATSADSPARDRTRKQIDGREARRTVGNRQVLRLDPRLRGFRDAIAATLDPAGVHLDHAVSNEQSGDGVLGTKLGWKEGAGLGEIMVMVARPGVDNGGFSPYFEPRHCSPVATHSCVQLRLPDGTTGIQQRQGGQLAVYYTRPDGQIVLIVESTLFGNNSTVPAEALPATARQMLRAATDPRLTLGS